MKSPITTHVLDLVLGKPGAGIRVTLERQEGAQWKRLGEETTNTDGRAVSLMTSPLEAGCYQLVFDLESYLKNQKREVFFPKAQILFNVTKPSEHYHIPLLLSGYGHSTYRGS